MLEVLMCVTLVCLLFVGAMSLVEGAVVINQIGNSE